MVNAELTDIDKEIFLNLPQLYDLVELSSTQYIKIVRDVREEESRPWGIKENAMLSGEDTANLIEALSKCDELFVTDEIHSVPDGIALNIDYSFRKLPKGVHPHLQNSLLDMDAFLENEECGERLNLVVYFSKDCWVSLHVLHLKKENPKCRVFFRWPSDEKYKGCADLELTEELKNLFVLAQEIVMKKATNGELEGIELKHE
jgi:hypothetical protein